MHSKPIGPTGASDGEAEDEAFGGILGKTGVNDASQMFRDLHGVQRCAFEELVAGGEQRDGASRRIAQVLTDAAHQNVILARSVPRHRKQVAFPVVHQPHARSLRQQRADLARRNRPFAFK